MQVIGDGNTGSNMHQRARGLRGDFNRLRWQGKEAVYVFGDEIIPVTIWLDIADVNHGVCAHRHHRPEYIGAMRYKHMVAHHLILGWRRLNGEG